MPDIGFTDERRDALQEVANMAMGRAGMRLAALLGVFIELSVPRVCVVRLADAPAIVGAMTGLSHDVTAVRQGFRADMKGEAIVICRADGVDHLCALMNDQADAHGPVGAYDVLSESEVVFDVANILIGACISSIFDQLRRTTVFSPPSLLGSRITLEEVFGPALAVWRAALLIEVNFTLEDREFRAHLVTLMAEDSIARMCDALDELLSSL